MNGGQGGNMVDPGRAVRERVITGLMLAAVVAAAVLFLPTGAVAVLLLMVMAGGAWEWAGLSGIVHPAMRLGYVASFLLVAAAAWLIAGEPSLVLLPAVVGVVWWAAVLVLLAFYRPAPARSHGRLMLLSLAGLPTLVPAWYALVTIHAAAPLLLLFVVALTAAADTGAWFCGRRFGREKLAPHISPGKTRAGVAGGMGAVLLLAAVGIKGFSIPPALWFYFVALCLVTAVLSVAGDLFESVLKREARAKDSGTILPGHGGILDRVDSLTAAAPAFLVGLAWGGLL